MQDFTPLDYTSAQQWAWWQEGNGPADVFLIAPTVDMGRNGNSNMDVADAKMRKRFLGALMQERLLFSDHCTLYSPFYRQITFPMQFADQNEDAYAVSRADLLAAFQQYLRCSQRPFLLAGFSQGAEMALYLLKHCFPEPSQQNRLVAAYLFGWCVTDNDLAEAPWLRLAQNETDSGIVCYSSEAPFITETRIVPQGVRTYGINPLTWRTDSTPADASLNLGACFMNYDGTIREEIPALTGAYRDPVRGTLKLPDIDPAEYPGTLFPDGVYHFYDFQFFYRNIQQNVGKRIHAYLEKQPPSSVPPPRD